MNPSGMYFVFFFFRQGKFAVYTCYRFASVF